MEQSSRPPSASKDGNIVPNAYSPMYQSIIKRLPETAAASIPFAEGKGAKVAVYDP